MPKKDGFGDQKKEAEKAKKRMAEMKKAEEKRRKEEEAAREEGAVASRSGSSAAAAKGSAALSTNGTFAAAAAEAAADGDEQEVEGEQEEVAAEDYDYDYDYDVATTSTSAASKAKVEQKKKADLKKQEKARRKDEFALLAQQEKLAKKQRIKNRFLQMLFVGVIMDLWKGGSNGSNGNHGSERKKAPASKDKKTKKVVESDGLLGGRSIKEIVEKYSGPMMVLVILVAVMYGKAMEDTYSGGRVEETNFYDVMGIPRDASVMDIRKKYKSLALNWHPDKNPDCQECPEKFAKISKAYDVLSNVEQKKAYDTRRVSSESLSSHSSVDLTAEDFEAKVLRSNEVFFVEVYDPNDGGSSSFHPIWEECSRKFGTVARFGRIDAKQQQKALSFLPQRIAITPIVFRFARGEATDTWMPQNSERESGMDDGSAPLMRWIADSYPQLHKMDSATELTSWWKQTGRSRFLISGNGGVIRRGAQNQQFFQVLREAHVWGDTFAVAAADVRDATEALKPFDIELPKAESKKGQPWSVVYIPAGETKEKVHVASTDDLKELPSKFEEVVQRALSTAAPHLTVRNHRQLCEAGKASRTFCLVLVDMPGSNQVDQVLQDVATSVAEYAKELAEMKDADSEAAEEEPFRIQPVRVMTGTSRYPSQPVAVGRDFYTAWAEVGYAPMFLIELETKRVSAVKASILPNLAQQIAYEDLKLKELPEGFQLLRALPDPEVPLMRVMFRQLSTPFGALFAFVALAGVSAIAPELPVWQLGAAGAGALMLLLLFWPLACRRLLSPLLGGV